MAQKCFYEILGVDRTVSDEDIKKAYRRLALRYHPDKNPDNLEECARIFHSIQHAYEVLSDPQERAWYDRHREEILYGVGSEFKDDVINIMSFFSPSVYTGYGDDSKGFYGVYGAVFSRIAEEEAQFAEDDSICLPLFGCSTSNYEEIVHPFYSYWQSFSTCRPYHWLNKYDRTQAPNRKVEKLMEKDNKKIRDAAKKKRNESIRQLVAFVRKRDKRVQAYKKFLEEKEEERQKRMHERKVADARKRLEELKLSDYKPQEWETDELFEKQMASMQAHLDAEFGKNTDSESGSEESDTLDLFCAACNKTFKSDKAFANHEKSKKHKENVILLKQALTDDDESDNEEIGGIGAAATAKNTADVRIDNEPVVIIESHDVIEPTETTFNDTLDNISATVEDLVGPDNEGVEEEVELLYSAPKKLSLLEEEDQEVTMATVDSEDELNRESLNKKTKRKKKGNPLHPPEKLINEPRGQSSGSWSCLMCKQDYSSRNKLFTHIKETGHATPQMGGVNIDSLNNKKQSKKLKKKK